MSTERRQPAADGLFLVGLVGRTGSGKSTLARMLAERGAEVIEADAVGHQVTDQDPAVREELIAEYGAAVYRPDGTLDRPRVAARVFADAEARARLDRLVHPRIVERIGGRLAALRAAGHRGTVVIDAALLLEWGLDRWCDAVVAVTAPEAQRIARLARSRGWSEEEARRRLGVQRDDRGFAAAADLTFHNDSGSLKTAEESARRVLDDLEAMAAERMKGKRSC
jgi:dephospho-CoA kinase